MSARHIVGDVLDVLRTLPDDSVDLVFTSPPFLALRSYLPSDHEHKHKEIGSEPTPGEYIDALLDVTEELARVLAPHGSLCFELGDTYSGSGGAGGDYGEGGLREGQPLFRAGTPRWDSRPEDR
jgi:DNA modification methylase